MSDIPNVYFEHRTNKEDKRIKSLDALKEYCDDSKEVDDCEVYILLNGMLRSSKYIQYNKDSGCWWIEHQISDESEEFDNDTALKEGYPLLFEAIDKGALIKY